MLTNKRYHPAHPLAGKNACAQPTRSGQPSGVHRAGAVGPATSWPALSDATFTNPFMDPQ
jgi:hypothetical protein